MKKLILLFAGIALLTVACKAEVNVLVDINEDRSGTIAFEFGLDEELRELLESQGGTADDLFGELDLDIASEGGTATERTDGDMTFTGATNDFDDISQVMTDLVGDTSGEGMFSEFSFVMDDESAALAATASSEDQDMGDLGIDPTTLTGEFFSANFILGMPGTVVEHNADEVLSDGRLKWSLPILGGTKTFVAKSEFGGGSSLWWLWIVLGVVLVVGVVAIIAAIVLGRRQEKQAVTDAAAQFPQSAADELGTPDTGVAADAGVVAVGTAATGAADAVVPADAAVEATESAEEVAVDAAAATETTATETTESAEEVAVDAAAATEITATEATDAPAVESDDNNEANGA
jgi:hypothetical protein